MKRTSLFEDDKSNLDKIQHSFKIMFFEIVHNLILGDNFPFFIYVFFILIESLQVFHFFFTDEFSSLWKVESWTSALNSFFSYFMIQSYLKNLSFQTYILVNYIVMGLIMLLLIVVLFIALKSASLGRMTGTLMILKIFFEVLNYVLFMPILQLFLTIFNCDNSTHIHKIYKDQQCYNGNYLLHVLLCCIASIILIGVSTLVTLMFFESRFQINNPQCKVTGREDLIFLIFKVVMVLCFTILDVQNQRLLIIIILTLFSIKLFHSFNKSSIYLNIYFAKLLNGQHMIILWTMMMVVLGLILENTDYDGAPQLWVICTPLLLIIILVRKEYRYEVMMVDSNKFDSLDQSLQLLQYLTKLVGYYDKDESIASLLDGFVEYHKVTCKRDDCPCSPKNMNDKRIEKFKKGVKDLSMKSQYVILIYIVEKIYVLSLTRYPNCIELRISHALFLYEKMQSTIQALQELALAEQEKPYLDQQFLIFRLRKIIEEQMFDSGNLTNVNEFTAENNLREIKMLIEKSTQLHLDFWIKLREDTPDLGKLYEVGLRMLYVDKVLDDQWKRIMKINFDMPPTLLMMYSRYLIDVLNDREEAEDVVERLKNLQTFDMDRGKIINNLKDFVNESTALISISAEDGNFSRILGLNQSCAKTFGYTKSELLDRKINVLMPNIYAQYHDQFLEGYTQNQESRVLNRERLLIGKHKSGYIFPFFIYVRYIPSLINGSQFFAAIKQERYFKNQAYMIVNSFDMCIENISAQFISLFHIDLNYISKKKTQVSDLIPQFEEFKQELMSKQGYETTVQYKSRDQFIQQQFQVYVSEINICVNRFMNNQNKEGNIIQTNLTLNVPQSQHHKKDERQAQLFGYIIKLEQIRVEKSILQTPSEHGPASARKQLNSAQKFLFQFDSKEIPGMKEKIEQLKKQYKKDNNTKLPDQYVYKFIGEYISDQNFQMSAISVSKQDETYEYSVKNDDEKTPSSKLEDKNNDLSLGIKTMILIGGQLFDSEEYKNIDIEEEEDGQSKIVGQMPSKQEEDQEQDNGNANVYKSKKTFVQFLKESKSANQSSLTCFRWNAALLIIFLGVLGLLNYILTQQLFFGVYDGYKNVINSNQRVALGQRILWQTIELYLLNQINPYIDQTKNIADQRQSLNQSISNLQELQFILQSAVVEGDQIDLIRTNSVKMTGRDQSGTLSTQLVDLNQGTAQILSKALELLQTYNPESQFFVSYNLLNNYFEAVVQSANIYGSQLREKLNGSSIVITLFIVACAFAVVSVPLIACMFSLVSQNQEIIMKLFLQIQITKVKTLVNICEGFFNSLQVGEEDDELHRDNEGFMDDDEVQDEDEEYLERHKKRKKYRYDLKNKRNFYLKFAISMVMLLGYFLTHFLIGDYLQNAFSSLIDEIEATSQLVPNITFSNNVIRQMIIDPTFEIKGSSSYLISSTFVKELYDLNTKIQKEHSSNIQYHNPTYNTHFDSLMKSGACSYLFSIIDIDINTCQSFIEGIIDQSLSLALSRYFEDIRSQLQEYNNIIKDPSHTISGTLYNFTSNSTYNKALSLLYTNTQMNEIDILQDLYLRQIFSYTTDLFLSCVQQDVDTNTTTSVAIFIVFLVVLVLIYLFFWWPTATKINNEIKKTTLLLANIPLSIIKRSKAIREYLNRMHEIE
ncbi:unnamed protein product [Paramecium primaurelia]|uniref:PAS domain-containing protein n=1 Tax=Paramecium primaurelia TaxID=5886 RepID=A0A8S1LR65_PARPR|nr:unnamed protein product [Paramecium primaurelia]